MSARTIIPRSANGSDDSCFASLRNVFCYAEEGEVTIIAPTTKEAHRLATTKGLELQEQADYSLAENYRQPVIGGLSTTKKALGFVS